MTLDAYLNDHLAAATAGCQLVAKLDQRFQSSPRGSFFASLSDEIETNRATLVALMADSGVPRQKVKQVLGWVGGKVVRIRLSDTFAGGPGLAALLEMEALGGGLQAQVALWQNLQAIKSTEPRLAAADLEKAAHRAERALGDLQRERTTFAAEVLGR